MAWEFELLCNLLRHMVFPKWSDLRRVGNSPSVRLTVLTYPVSWIFGHIQCAGPRTTLLHLSSLQRPVAKFSLGSFLVPQPAAQSANLLIYINNL